jgi:hypothetical protein
MQRQRITTQGTATAPLAAACHDVGSLCAGYQAVVPIAALQSMPLATMLLWSLSAACAPAARHHNIHSTA